ncbi:hypothetical protein HMPREF2805_00305, partial [Streptococcus sp. HMSC034E03]|uniref:conserved phage C-terminal domain-containing protein n=1 Tax=Streptococcus sp. HMSC034E03 TaxID=1739309 RepID=UPI0008CDCB21
GNVFQYYTNEQLMVDLNSSEKTIIKFKKELKDVGLLKEVRQGNNLPNRIYISAVDGTVNSTVSELEILQTNKTDNNEIDNNNNKLSICKEIISYLNLKAKKNFKVNTASHHKFIKARLKEGYALEDFKKVVDIMVAKWKGTEYEQYLQPQTLFGNKMDNYLNQPMPKRSTILTSTVDERLGF